MKKWSAILIISLNYFCLLAQEASEPYSFFVAGHAYGAAGVNNVGLHPPFVEKFSYIQNRPEISFGVFTGDIVSPNPIAQDWDEVDQDIADLGLQIYFAVGNHDMENRPLFEDRYGDTYFQFIHENDLFIILDPNIDGWSITGVQMEFLENTVSDNHETVENIFVFFHQMLWVETDNIYSGQNANSQAGREDPINFWQEVLPLFTGISNHTAFFAGDVGAASWSIDFMYDSFDNIEFIASGMGEGIGDNIVVINVAADKTLDYDLVCLNEEETECFGELTDYQLSPSSVVENDLVSPVIFPNPAREFVLIDIPEELKDSEIQLINLQGEVVFTQGASLDQEKIITHNLPAGIYILRLFNEKESLNFKLVLER